MRRSAVLSDDRVYRYSLIRSWDDSLPTLAVIGLNPSKADENVDDPTIRKCIKFAAAWGFGSLKMLNLFAYRSTDPKELFRSGVNPIGPLNKEMIFEEVKSANKVLAAWGNNKLHAPHAGLGDWISNSLFWRLVDLECLAINKSGSPKHPLYCRDDSKPIPYRFAIESFPPAIVIKGLAEHKSSAAYFGSTLALLEYESQAKALGWIDYERNLTDLGSRVYEVRNLVKLASYDSKNDVAELYDRSSSFDWNKIRP